MNISNLKHLKDGNLRLFVLLNVLYNGVNTVLTIFMNTFLLNFLGRNEVLIYNLIMALTQPLSMVTSLYVSKRKGYLFSQRLGFIFYVIIFTLLSILGARLKNLYWLFAVFISFGTGYFYTTFSVEMLKYANDDNRDIVQGSAAVLTAIVSLFLPIISAIMISKAGEDIGYKMVFAMVAILIILALIVSLKLKDLGKKEGKINVIKPFITFMKNKNGRKIMIANGIDNGKIYTILFYVPVILTLLNPDPFVVSLNSSIGNIVGIISALFYGIIVNKNNRIKSILVASIITMLGCSILWINYSIISIIIFAAIFTLCSYYVQNPIISTHFKVAESIRELEGCGAEIHIIREVFASIGRIVGIALIFAFPETKYGIIGVLTIILSLNFISTYIVYLIEKDFEKSKTCA